MPSTGKPKSNDYVNELRAKVGAWRSLSPAQQERTVTPVTAQLLRHWRNPERERRLFFCQIEAVETAIWLAEVAPRAGTGPAAVAERRRQSRAVPRCTETRHRRGQDHGHGDADRVADAEPARGHAGPHASPMPSWLSRPASPSATRLRVLMPSDPNNTHTLHDLVPPDMRDTLQQARVVITNYHAFQRRETMEAPKLAKAILGGRSGPVQTLESEGMMIRRVCGDLLARKQIVVLNDEAHHCYRERQSAKQARISTEERSGSKAQQ